MEFTGKLEAVVNERKWKDKNDNEQSSIDFVLKTEGQYPEVMVFTAGKTRAALNGVAIGTEITVSFNGKGREWQNRWFNQLDAWRIEVKASQVGAGDTKNEPNNNTNGSQDFDGLPF